MAEKEEDLLASAPTVPPEMGETDDALAETWLRGPSLSRASEVDEEMFSVSPEQPGRYRSAQDVHQRAELGRGGMGRVVIAFDAHLGRQIAIKELLAGVPLEQALSPDSEGHESVARFLREARVTAQLEHPNIVPVYELGKRSDGTLYYAMKLVRGRTLSEAVKRSADLHERLRLLGHYADLCHAIAYAHSRGVVHRDIKPQNVMLGEFGETLVLDWGLAKVRGKRDLRGKDLERGIRLLRDAEGFQTLAGSAFGTPAYMSPEQADGKIDEVDERSDVWSLGVVLYELLTGKLPFEGPNPLAVMVRVSEGKFLPVLSVAPEAPVELAAVVQRALAAEKSARYQTAKELAEEIEAFQAGERVEAYQYSAWRLFTKYLETHRVQVLTTIFAIISLLVIAFFVDRGEREKAEMNIARNAEMQMNSVLAGALSELARSRAAAHDWMGAELYAAAAAAREPAPEATGLLMRISGEWRPKLLWETNTWPTGCLRVLLSPDAKTVSCPMTSDIAFWDAASGGERPWLRAAGGWAHGLAYAPDGRAIAWGGDDGLVRVWDLEKKAIVVQHPGGRGAVEAIAFSPDGLHLASGAEDGTARIAAVSSGEAFALPSVEGGVSALAYSPDGAWVALAGADGRVHIAEAGGGRERMSLSGHEARINDLAFSPDGRLLASASADRTVRLWDVAGGFAQAGRLVGHEGEVYAVRFGADGRSVFSGGADKTVRVWDRASGEVIAMLDGHGGAVRGLAVSADGARLISAADDKSLRAWDLSAARAGVPAMIAHPAAVRAVAAAPDKPLLITSSADGKLQIFDLSSGSGAARLLASGTGSAIAVSPDGGRIAAVEPNGDIRLWPMDQGEPIVLHGHSSPVEALEYSADGALVSGGGDQTVRVWNTAEGRELARLSSEGEACGAVVSLSSREHWIAAACEDGRVRIWDASSKRVAATIAGRGARVHRVLFAPSGELLAVGSSDQRVHLYDAGGGSRGELAGFEDAVTALAFSRDGRLLAAGSEDRTVRIFDLSSRTEVARLEGHREAITGLAFTSDGAVLASASKDRTLRLWKLEVLGSSGPELRRRAERDFGLELSGSKIAGVHRAHRE